MHTEYNYEPRQHPGYSDSEINSLEFMRFLRQRWRLILVAAATAFAISLGVSILLPKRYTATASIVIEPPGGNDPRTATAVSPVYLESLKSYEHFASSDSLFAGAVQKFHLTSGDSGRSIEGLKQQVLKVTKLKDTKILEISATLQDPELAQQLANYLAEETVKLTHGENVASDSEVIGEAERQAEAAQQRLDRAHQADAAYAAREPSGELQPEIEADVDLAEKVRQSLIEARSDIADYEQKPDFAREIPGLKARAAELEKRLNEIEAGIARKSALQSRRGADRQKLDGELKMAQTASETAAARLRDLRATSGTRGERLRVIDPGIVPQRPSSPNVILNVVIAELITLIAVAAYLALLFSIRTRRTG